MSSNPPERDLSRPRHAWLYALREPHMPAVVTCAGERFVHVRTFKHDFFAATGLYRGPGGLAVLKMGRVNDCATIPMDWIGRFLTRREVRLYEMLQDVDGVPRLIGMVGEAAFLHEYVPGHPLRVNDRIADGFFDELMGMLDTLRERHIAYVDLNKRENVLMGEDGRPHLIDFQISLYLPPIGWRRLAPLRWFLSRFQQADRYHCLKHKRRLRPDLLSETELEEVTRLSLWIRLHRRLTRPLTDLRRRTLKRLAKSETTDVAGSGAK